MSEHENNPPSPSKQTSSIPLKKETVRVTLKAADAPPAIPSATVPMAPPVRPPVPSAPPTPTAAGGAPRPPAPAPTIPLRSAGAPIAAPTPTIALRSAGAPIAAPAPTIRLAGNPNAPRPVGTPTMALPKATVQLQAPTSPLGVNSTPSSIALKIEEDDDVEEKGDTVTGILSIVGFVAALVVLSFQLMTANTWISASDNLKSGEWSQLLD